MGKLGVMTEDGLKKELIERDGLRHTKVKEQAYMEKDRARHVRPR